MSEPSSRRLPLALLFSTLFLALTSLAVGWAAFWVVGELGLTIPLLGGGRIQPMAATAAAEGEAGTDMAIFWEAMTLLDENYYTPDELPRGSELTYSAIEGIVEATSDPHTGFMDPLRAQQVQERLEGEFEGIGAQVEMSEAGLVIVSPFPDTPAEKAGLQPGDLVLEVDGQRTEGLTVTEAAALVRGPAGSAVRLLVQREGAAELLTFEVTRGRIIIPTIESRIIEAEGAPRIGYIRLYDFGARSSEQFQEGLSALLADGAEVLIFDLRNNPGGFLSASVEIASQFIGEGLILSEKGSNGRDEEHRAESGGVALTVPLVILINEGSASASEIVAGAIRDQQRGTLIGSTSFGKGSVQITRDLSDGSSMRITIARWFTPNGTAIHEVGIEPDIAVPFPDETPAGEDPQLDAAINFFKQP